MTIKTIRPSGPAIGLLKGTSEGIHPPVHYGMWKRRIVDTNPCSEIIFGTMFGDYLMNKEDSTPHSRRQPDYGFRTAGQGSVEVSGRAISGSVEFDDYESTLTIKVPGVEPERINITRVENRLRVTILPEDDEEIDIATRLYNSKILEYIMDIGETVAYVNLDLGILTVVFDRNLDIEDFEIGHGI